MSLILDALNRADQQRNTQVDPIGMQASQSPAQSSLVSALPWAISTVCLIVVMFFAIYLLRLQTTPIVEQTSTIKSAVPVLSSDAKSFEKLGSSQTREQLDESEPLASAEKLRKGYKADVKFDPLASSTMVNTLAKKTAAGARQTDPTVLSLYDRAPVNVSNIASTNSEPMDAAIPTDTLVPEPSEDPTIKILQQIPLITERSTQFQRSIPSIDYEVHAYSGQQGSGFVKLNGKIHKVGAQIAPGLRLIAILDNSVVLDMKGIQFRLPALNSWVNYN